ncbi:hypothetical protein J4218_05220 [Candidatus Pacearchaeota archaeon]|nr:hypothetical protein [Candidatus Pacearchaeota archaeon]
MALETCFESVEEYAGFISPEFRFNPKKGINYENTFCSEGRGHIFYIFPVILRKMVENDVKIVLSSTYGPMKSIVII